MVDCNELSEQLAKFDLETLPFEVQIGVFHEGLESLWQFVSDTIVPRFKSLQNLGDKNQFLKDIYDRIYLWVKSLLVLDSKEHFQAIASGLRSIFELYIDLHLLATDKIPDGVRKYKKFPKVKKFTIAVTSYELAKKYRISCDSRKKLAQDTARRNEAEQLVASLWHKPKPENIKTWPLHWSGESFRKRVLLLGSSFVEMYMDISDIGNMYVHSDPTGYAGMSPDFPHQLAFHGYNMARRILCEATDIILAEISEIDTPE